MHVHLEFLQVCSSLTMLSYVNLFMLIHFLIILLPFTFVLYIAKMSLTTEQELVLVNMALVQGK